MILYNFETIVWFVWFWIVWLLIGRDPTKPWIAMEEHDSPFFKPKYIWSSTKNKYVQQLTVHADNLHLWKKYFGIVNTRIWCFRPNFPPQSILPYWLRPKKAMLWRNATVLSFLKSQSINDHQQRRWNIDDHQRRTNMFYMEGRRLLCPLGLQRLQNDVK